MSVRMISAQHKDGQKCETCYECFSDANPAVTHNGPAGEKHPPLHEHCFKEWAKKNPTCMFCRAPIDLTAVFSWTEQLGMAAKRFTERAMLTQSILGTGYLAAGIVSNMPLPRSIQIVGALVLSQVAARIEWFDRIGRMNDSPDLLMGVGSGIATTLLGFDSPTSLVTGGLVTGVFAAARPWLHRFFNRATVLRAE